jgi:pimeloyl-ACP methyl ester carboxylesterase
MMTHVCKYAFTLLLACWSALVSAQITLPAPHVEAVLYLGEGKHQPLVVGLGGSEGGNAWTSDHWKATRDQFIAKGYAFLAIGYFRAPGAPDTLNRIALEHVHDAIALAARDKRVNKKRIAVIGGSRGADLALLLGSHYKDIDCVVSIVGSNAVFPGHTNHFSTSCWTFQGQELPFVPVNEASVPFLMARDLRGAFEAMLTDSAAVAQAAIPVERIRGPVYFLSATQDEICPSTAMADSMVARLKAAQFKYAYAHKAIEGGHGAPLQHFEDVFAFLAAHFPVR